MIVAAKLLSLLGSRAALGAAGLLGALALVAAVWGHGYRTMQARCETAALQAANAALKRDLDNALESVRDANRRAAALQKQTIANEEVVRDYEERLKARPDGACALGDDDVRRLQRIGPGPGAR